MQTSETPQEITGPAIDAAYDRGRIDGYESGLKGEDFSDFPTNPDLAHQYEAGFEAGYAKGNRDREGQDFSDFEGTIEALLPR